MAHRPTYKELEQKIKELEKKVAEGEMSKKELLQERDLFLKGPVVVFKWAAKENWPAAYVSPNMTQFGYSADDFIDNKILYIDIIHPDDVERVVSEVQTYIEAGLSSYEQEYRIMQADGEVRWVYDRTVVLRDEKNEIIFFNGYIVDNTKRKIAEGALQESEIKHKTLVQNIPGMVYRGYSDWSAEIISGSVEICGYTNKELNSEKKNWLNIIHSDDKARVLRESSELVKRKQKTVQTYRIVTKGGNIRFVEDRKTPLFSEEGEFIGIDGIVFDINDRKKAEKALRESEENFRTLVETMTDGLGIQDKDGLITYVNNKLCQMLGYKPDDFLGRQVSDFLDDKNKRIMKEQVQVRRKGKVKPYELIWDRKDGSKISTVMSPQAIFDEKKQFEGSFAVITDISDLKRSKEVLQKAHNELEQRVEERTKELKIKTKGLEELNTAMKVLLEKRKEDEIKLEDNVFANVRELIGPLFDNMRETKLDAHQKMILSIMESNLNEITSHFTRKLSLKYLNLTPTEMKIANFIKHGTTTKKIAEIMKSSPRTIETHRKNIREKVGLKKNRRNLRSYLMSLH